MHRWTDGLYYQVPTGVCRRTTKLPTGVNNSLLVFILFTKLGKWADDQRVMLRREACL